MRISCRFSRQPMLGEKNELWHTYGTLELNATFKCIQHIGTLSLKWVVNFTMPSKVTLEKHGKSVNNIPDPESGKLSGSFGTRFLLSHAWFPGTCTDLLQLDKWWTTNIYLDISGYQYISIKIWWFPEIGVPPNHQFYIIGFSIINQPFLDTPVYLDMIYLPSLDPIRQSPAWHSRGPAQHGGGACGAKGRRVQGQTLRNGAQHKPCHHLGRWNLKDEKSDENLLWLYTYIYIHIQYTHVVCPSVVKSIYIYTYYTTANTSFWLLSGLQTSWLLGNHLLRTGVPMTRKGSLQ